MNSERSSAYGRVMRTIEEIGPAKLQSREIELIRESADTLLFSEDLEAPGAREALEQVNELIAMLVEADRWTEERAQQLGDDVAACGPVTLA